ncbi:MULTISPECIES: DUF3703 domain-containing protein [unclassified Leptospira]|uniref:DUF3703 domain-containing protein n=1 Tax=unclassified Leptospira TaxID=2633828 RepID=UPI0002BD5070|nr:MULTISPECIES: DUF3703 domain-containing protein [unclassified Leptospira]EMK01591.1 PF12487 family protein [Leptospira sp. B5-022]MCR1795272.1 DUF3703 domain-containing protein [Leptospira sp. id769339]
MNWIMPKDWKIRYKKELDLSKKYEEEGNLKETWRYLERAHLIGQYYPIPHTGIHFRMLLFAIDQKDIKEIAGQLIRVSFGWLGSWLNKIPVGNTGGANVPIFQPMPIPEDLLDLLSEADQTSKSLSGLKKK